MGKTKRGLKPTSSSKAEAAEAGKIISTKRRGTTVAACTVSLVKTKILATLRKAARIILFDHRNPKLCK